MFDVTDWNADPNQRWIVRLSDSGADVLVELYSTVEDAIAQTNRVAYANVPFGVDVKVLLTPDATPPAAGLPLMKFNEQLDYHLKVTGVDGDALKRFAIGPFTDIQGVEDPLMLTEKMITARGQLEINKGTHSRIYSSLTLGRHFPDLDEGAIVTVSSSRRGISAVRQKITNQTLEIQIEENLEVRFFDDIETVEYQDFIRQ